MKPVLFHDIDGVLFGDYDGQFQLRPSVKTWLAWASEHFEVVWLTTWNTAEIRTLLSILYCEKYLKSLISPPFQAADWTRFMNKESWLSSQAAQLAKVDWYWIDDNIPDLDKLWQLGLDPRRCVTVNPKGADELQNLREQLSLTRNCAKK